MPNRVEGIRYSCRLCHGENLDKGELLEHLLSQHELPEVASFCASTMIQEEERDVIVTGFVREFRAFRRERNPRQGASNSFGK